MNLFASLNDSWLVARFEVLRAVRTWRALALIAVFVVADVGATGIFVEILGQMEEEFAVQMGVATTSTPGSMLTQMRDSETLMKMVGFFVGSEELAERMLSWPLLAIFQLWIGFGLVPYLGTTAASESISTDLGSRALRYEAARTGRAELVAGRYFGQIVLTVAAALIGQVATWCTAMATMVVADPVELGLGLFTMGMRAVVLAIPFVGIGVGVSQLSTSAAWARVLAIVMTSASWITYWTLLNADDQPWVTLADVVLPLLPQSYMAGLWEGGMAAGVSTASCVGLGFAYVSIGYLRFARRDL